MKGGEDYLRMYPKLNKWMNRCGACNRVGYKPALPDEVTGSSNLRKMFPPLELDTRGLCEQCRLVVTDNE